MDVDQKSNTVFVVHGRNKKARRALFDFLRAIDLRPLEWDAAVHLTDNGAPYIGEVINRGFSQAQAVVVLLTPDDEVLLRPMFQIPSDPDYETHRNYQPRPNVFFEAGMAMALHSDSTIIIKLGRMKPFSDLEGHHVIRAETMADISDIRHQICHRLKKAGCDVNQVGRDWQTAGDFEGVLEALEKAANEAFYEPTGEPCRIRGREGDNLLFDDMRRAKKAVWISGITLNRTIEMIHTPDFQRKVDDGCEFRFLAITPSISAEVAQYLGEFPEDLEAVLSTSLRRLGRCGGIQLKTLNHRPAVGFFIIDPNEPTGHLTISPYFYKVSGFRSPVFTLDKVNNPGWFQFCIESFEKLWNDATPYP